MAEWLVERGIGETRAALVERDAIVEARIVLDGVLAPGTVLPVRLVARFPERGSGIVAFDGGEALIVPLPAGIDEGGTCLAEITREAISEPGKPKRARARPAAAGAVPGIGPDLFDALAADGYIVTRIDSYGPDRLEAAGWGELLDEAATGTVRFAEGALTVALTPAMTVIDVDGTTAPATLLLEGARAAARAVRRLDIGGSIGIDLPTVPDRSARHAAAEAVDALLPQPFERTAVNGFGFLQIVRRRSRRSLLELQAEDPAAWWARGLLRQAERSSGAGERTLTAAPPVIAVLASRPDWIADLVRRLGATLVLREDSRLAISAGHVSARFP